MTLIEAERALAIHSGDRRPDRDVRRLRGQHHVRCGVVRGPGGLHRQGRARRPGRGVPSRPARRRRGLRQLAGAGRGADGALPDRGDPRCPADHEHVPRRVLAARTRRCPDGGRGVRSGGVHGGLPVRQGRGQGRLPQGRRGGTPRRAKVSLTLSDSFCVDRHRQDFLALVRDEVDLLFANDDEIWRCTRWTTSTRRSAGGRDCELAAMTVGAEGSLVVSTRTSAVKAEPVARWSTHRSGRPVRGRFPARLHLGADLAECGRLGSVAAAEVISHVGARPSCRCDAGRFGDASLGTIAPMAPGSAISPSRSRSSRWASVAVARATGRPHRRRRGR